MNFIKKLLKAFGNFSPYKSGGASGNIPSPRYTSIDLDKVVQSTVQNTNSMEPLLDVGHTILLGTYETSDNVDVGDIIIYTHKTRGNIIHSVIEIGTDDVGWYCVAQGLNLNEPDIPEVRWEQITNCCVGVLWSDKFYSYIPEKGD